MNTLSRDQILLNKKTNIEQALVLLRGVVDHISENTLPHGVDTPVMGTQESLEFSEFVISTIKSLPAAAGAPLPSDLTEVAAETDDLYDAIVDTTDDLWMILHDAVNDYESRKNNFYPIYWNEALERFEYTITLFEMGLVEVENFINAESGK